MGMGIKGPVLNSVRKLSQLQSILILIRKLKIYVSNALCKAKTNNTKENFEIMLLCQ